jgi:hypothetical protein
MNGAQTSGEEMPDSSLAACILSENAGRVSGHGPHSVAYWGMVE